jgi:hypothetical protein
MKFQGKSGKLKKKPFNHEKGVGSEEKKRKKVRKSAKLGKQTNCRCGSLELGL